MKLAHRQPVRHCLSIGIAILVAGALCASTGTLAAQPLSQSAVTWPTIALTQVVNGLTLPIHIAHAGDGSGRRFVVEKAGRIKILAGGSVISTPFLNISSKVNSTGSEQGLLSVAFPPDYANKGYFYVFYTKTGGALTIARYSITANPDLADPNSEQIILTINHPTNTNHNGGQLAFGPDGYLYIGTGDGGGGGDPNGNGQNPNTLLGKVLRIDAESGVNPYAIPPTNPFVGKAGLDEIWALGLRNPWRFSFDRQTGNLYTADVGQSAFEEVNYQAAGGTGGQNYGWNIMEGDACYNASTCNTAGLTRPVVNYGHALGCSVTGGLVNRGTLYPSLNGIYFYGDFCTGRIWGLQFDGAAWQSSMLLDTTYSISSFGEDQTGELYLADYGAGTIYRLIDPTTTPDHTFADVPPGHWAATFIEAYFAAGLTQGCNINPLIYCPDRLVTRAEKAVFLLRAKYSGSYTPPPLSGFFDDVPVAGKEWMEPWIDQFYRDGITQGCAIDPLRFCPEREVTRAEAAVFVLRAKYGNTYSPPPAEGIFADVPVVGKEWMQPWIEEFYRQGITTGCLEGPLRYCPERLVTRAEMAVFIARAFDLLP